MGYTNAGKSTLFALLTRLGMAARPATFATLGLSNYSEFALIVGGVAAKAGWISPDWLLVFALALSVTYVLAAPASMRAENLFERLSPVLHRFEREQAEGAYCIGGRHPYTDCASAKKAAEKAQLDLLKNGK